MTKEISKVIEQETVRVKSLSFHPNKPIIISGHHNGAIKAWDYQMSTCVHDFLGHEGSVRAVLFHPKEDIFISGGDDMIIRVWNYTERRIINRLCGHTDFVRSLDFHQTRPWILSSSDDMTIIIWNFLTGKLLATARGHSHYVMAARFLGENLFLSGSLDQSIRVWDFEGLYDATKKSSLLPDVVTKQIIDNNGGVNAIAVFNGIFSSGGDGADVKVCEWSDMSIHEKKVFFIHQRSVTGLLCTEKYILSSGEDGIFSIFDLDEGRNVEQRIDGRYWCVARKGNLCAAGHDSGFEVFNYAEPKVVHRVDGGLFYFKDLKVHFSDYKTEKVVCKLKKGVVSICADNDYLLVQYNNRFEVFKNEVLLMGETGEGILLGDGDLVFRKDESIYRTTIGSGEQSVVLSSEGKLLRGQNKSFFIVKERMVTLLHLDGSEYGFCLPFKPLKPVCSNNRIAWIGNNDVSIHFPDMRLINTTSEMSPITDGFFSGDVFIYATHKHLKYISEDKGVLKSAWKIMIPLDIREGMLYFFSDDGIECTEIDLVEIEFKKAVDEDRDISKLIEEGSLPGVSPLSYLVRKKKGFIALPYINDNRQRFELCLSDFRLDECLKYYVLEKDVGMGKRLAEAAIRKGDIDIAERCLKDAKEWNMLFMLYICSKKDERMIGMTDFADDATKSAIMLYLEDRKYFRNGGNSLEDDCRHEIYEEGDERSDFDFSSLKDVLSKSSASANLKDVSDGKDLCIEHKEEESIEFFKDVEGDSERNGDGSKKTFCEVGLSVSDTIFTYPISDKALNGYVKSVDRNLENCISKALLLTTEGKLNQAIRVFREAIINIAFEIRDRQDCEYLVKERRRIGSYISGLSVERSRRETESPLKNVMMAIYFASLPLEEEHHVLAASTAITVLRKYKNFNQAKTFAKSLKRKGFCTKAVEKALSDVDSNDVYVLPAGTFCVDVLDIRAEKRTCLFCFVNCAEGDLCVNCKVGVLQ